MDLRSGCPFWLVKSGLLNVFPPLERDLKCDALVVGGGITGALLAYHLIEAAVDTVLVDRREIGWGSTAASTALLQYEIDTPLTELSRRLGKDHAVRAYQACGEAIGKIQCLTESLSDDCGFKSVPSLLLAKRRADIPFMKKEGKARLEAGFQVQHLTERDLKAQTGIPRPYALLSEEGGQVDAYRLTHALLAKAMEKGLRVYDRTNMLRYDIARGGVVAHLDRGFRVRARHIAFATGYEVQEILKRKLVALHSTYAFVSEPMSGKKDIWHRNALIWEHANPYLYLRTTDDHRIIIGGEDEEFQDDKKRDALLESKIKTLRRKFRHLFPDLPLEVAFSWTGTFGETKDGLAYIGQVPECPYASFSLGFGGNGITYSVLAAEIIRDTFLGRPNPYNDLFCFNR